MMVIAKTNSAHTFLADQFKDRKVKKKYIGLTWGLWDNVKGEINEPLLRDKKDPTKYSVNCLLYTSPSPRDLSTSRMPSSA